MVRAPLDRHCRRHAIASLVVAVVFTSACNTSESVGLAFRASPGTTLEYEIAISSEVVTRLEGPAVISNEQIRLDAEQVVLGVDEAGIIDLEITMRRSEGPARVFEVRLDPRRGLASVDAVQGLPVEALGELGPSRLVLLANGIVPTHPLRPGRTWVIERRLELPEGKEQLTGQGRLAGLRHEDGLDLARVEATTTIPVDRELTLDQGRVRMSGEEHTRARLDYSVSDGTVQTVRSVTSGRFDLAIVPPSGSGTLALAGTLDVRVESRTVRVG